MSVKPNIKELCRAAAAHFNIPVQSFWGDSGARIYAWPRQMVMFLAVDMLNRSLSDIGASLGGRDHTTVLYGCRAVERAAEGDEVLTDLMVVASLATSYARARYDREMSWAQDLHAGTTLVTTLPAVAKPGPRRPRVRVILDTPYRHVIPRRLALPSDLKPPTRAQLMGARA